MALLSPNDRFSEQHMEFRKDILKYNGLHIIYTMGRFVHLYQLSNVLGFSGLEVIVLGMRLKDILGKFGLQCTAAPNRFAAIEIDNETIRTLNNAGQSVDRNVYRSRKVNAADAFGISLRCLYNNGEHFQNYFYDTNIDSIGISYKNFMINTYMSTHNFMILSCHLIDRGNVKIPNRSFPIEKWLRGTWVKLSVGAFVSCQAVYSGTDEIRVNSLTATESLGRPLNPYSTVKITIRRTLDTFVFATDYDKVVVMNVVSVLGNANSDSMPAFSSNVLLKRVVVTSMF